MATKTGVPEEQEGNHPFFSILHECLSRDETFRRLEELQQKVWNSSLLATRTDSIDRAGLVLRATNTSRTVRRKQIKRITKRNE